MTPRTGGEAAKFGQRYEGRWTVRQLLDVLSGRALSLVVEDEAALAEGAEFTLRRFDGPLEVHQVKRQLGVNATWTQSRLLKKGVLAAMALHADAEREFRFISVTPTPWLAALADKARRSDDLDGFIRVQLDGLGGRRDFDGLAANGIWGSPEHAWSVLRRVDAHWPDERELVETNAVLAEQYLTGADPRLMAVGLGDLIVENLGVRLDVPTVHRLLANYGMAPNPLVDGASLTATVAATVERWSTSITSELLTPEIWRPQATTIAERLVALGDGMTLVAGTAGTGKSAVLRQAVADLIGRGWATLALRVDRLEPFLTATELAGQLDLGDVNPVVALASIAQEGPSVLVIDQLDAVSFASGRLPRQLDPIVELLEQTKAFPEMRVLLACRQYDLDNDSRLGALVADGGPAQLETVGLLSDEELDAAVGELGVDPARLSTEQRSLLSAPLNLVLLAAIADESTALEFSSPKDLLDRFYERKERDSRRRRDPVPVRFNAVISRLAERMSAEQRLSLPRSVLDTDDLTGDADVLASEHVITFERGQVAFFHEAFFDYAFARVWASDDRELMPWLLEGDQELFRRSQVRQILTRLRDVDPGRFVAELRACLNHERIRAHIKDVMLSLLGSLASPSEAEWGLVGELLEGDGWVSERAWSLLRSEPWFARLDAEGSLAEWFISTDGDTRARGVEIARAGAPDHGDRVAELLATLEDRSEAVRALLWIARPPALARSRDLFEQMLAAVREGAVPGAAQQLFIDAAHLEREEPSWAIKLLVAWLSERPGALAVTTMRVDALESQEYGLQRLIAGAGEAEPAAFARALIPYVISVADATAYGRDKAPILDLQFGDREPHKEHPDVGDTFLSTMAYAIRAIATDYIETLDGLVGPLLAAPYDTAQWLAYQGLIAAGETRAERSADVLLESKARLQSGFPTNPYWTTRELLLAIAGYLDGERIARLEAAILGLEPEYEGTRGYARFTLLSALPEARLSAAGAQELAERRAEFGQDEPGPPPPSVTVVSREPSLSPTANFSDEQWLAAMRDGISAPTTGMEADATRWLAHALAEATKLEPTRFAELGLRIDDSFDPIYLLEVLKALGDPAEPVPAEALWSLVRHSASLEVPEHSRWIGWPLHSVTGEDVPDDILDLIIDVALHARDPIDHSAEPEARGAPPSDVFMMSGLNSARGQAANTLARLIAADTDGRRTARATPVLGQLARDSSLGVRGMVADVFSTCLMHARSATSACVPLLLDTDDRLLAAPTVQNLLYYLVPTDVALVERLIDRMLASTNDSVREASGEMAAYIALEFERPERLEAALGADAASRSGAARMCARRLPFAGDGELAATTLSALLDDQDDGVRAACAEVAAALRGRPLRPHLDLLKKLVASRVFGDALPQLEITLREAPDDQSELLRVTAERFLEEFQAELTSISSRASIDARQLAELVIRWYGRSEGDREGRCRALDILDRLIASESYGIADLIGEAERGE